MTLEELERCFYQAVVDDYQQAFDDLRRQRPCVLWEQAAAQSEVPQYLGSPDDLKRLLMKAKSSKTPHQDDPVSCILDKLRNWNEERMRVVYREWAARQVNLVRFTEFPRGGHFMAWEEPELYAKDIQDFVRELRG